MLRKMVILLVMGIIAAIAGTVLFFPFSTFVKEKITDSLGPQVAIKDVQVSWNRITADEVTIKTPHGTDFLQVKQLKVTLSFWGFLTKTLDMHEVELISPELTLKRTRGGQWLLPEFPDAKGQRSLKITITHVKVRGGQILMDDHQTGGKLRATDVMVEVKNEFSLLLKKRITFNASLHLPPGGTLTVIGDGSIPERAFNGVLSVSNLDMHLLKPYMRGRTRVKQGRVSLASDVSLKKGFVKAPSVVRLKDLRLERGDILMGVTAPLLLELIKKRGEVVVSFTIWGRWDNLQNDLSEALTKKAVAETGRKVTSPLGTIVEGIKGLVPGL